ncbi:MAG: 2-hydroxychromene-2-carboxylate isomerase [Neomegalonema sp.]|nr:2-hydroxychromene-2-carboxylate isomerase [Neomegalonema sp.]
MTRATIDYYYAPISGFAYLGEPRLRAIATAANAEIRYRPVDIARVFAASETTPPFKQSDARLSYRMEDLTRCAARFGLPINPKPTYWPTPTDLACRIIIAVDLTGGDVGRISFAFLRAVWAEERDIASEATASDILSAAGFDALAILGRAAADETRAAAEAYTHDAIAAQVFGSPTYVLDGARFLGQDRLDYLAAALGVEETA